MGNNMNKSVLKSGPYCAKCKQPMAWHSAQQVGSEGGEETINVFECASCGRLSAQTIRAA